MVTTIMNMVMPFAYSDSKDDFLSEVCLPLILGISRIGKGENMRKVKR